MKGVATMDSSEKRSSSGTGTGIGLKYFKTISLSLACMSLGLCIAVIGPALPTLAYNLQVDIKFLSFIVLARAAGYLIGSILSGLIYDKLDPYLMIFFAMISTAIGTVIIPYLNHVYITAVAISTVGLSMGFLDTAGNVMCLQTWGEKSAPFLQTLHFSFALGTTIAPLLAIPFIMDVGKDSDEFDFISDNTTVSSRDRSTMHMGATTSGGFVKFFDVTYIFVICAVITGLVGGSFLYLSCFHRGSSVSDQKNTIKEEGSAFRIKMLILLFCFFLIYVGAEVSFGVYIYTFAIKSENKYSKEIASILNSIFWGAFAAGRFIAIPISKFFSPSRVLQANLFGTVVSAVTLACFPLYAKSADFLLWIAIAVYGLSMASIFPTGISWAEQYITVTGKVAMVLVVGAATGEMLCPFIAAQFVEENPMYLMYFAVGSVCASVINYLLLVWLARTKGKRLQKEIDTKIEDGTTEGLTGTKLESKDC